MSTPEQIVLWTFDRATKKFDWHMPVVGHEGDAVLNHFGLDNPDPVIVIDNNRVAMKLSDALSEGASPHFSGHILNWSGQALFANAPIVGRSKDHTASGAVVIRSSEMKTAKSPTLDEVEASQTDQASTFADEEVATLAKAQRSDPDFTSVLIEAIEALPEAFVLYDRDDRMVVCNEQYRRLYSTVADMMAPGLSFHDVMSESVRRGVFQLSENAEQWSRKRLSFHHANIGFFEQHLSDGRWIQVSERKTPSGATSSIRADITILKEREINLRMALDQANNELATRNRFVAKVGHELRNPLNIVYNLAQSLTAETNSPSRQRTMDTLFGAASAMRDVLRDFLDVTSLRRGDFTVEPKATDTRELLPEIVDFSRLMGRQSAVSFRSHTSRNIPRQIMTDRHRIRQIMYNLLGNAFKYAPGGSVVLSASTTEDENGISVLRIAVTDSGKGIGSTLGAQVFTPYTRNREHRLEGIEGLGLGLAISEELAAALGITLGVKPAVEGGTRAWIDIPIVGHDELENLVPRSAPPKMPLSTGPSMNVLVIDDEPANLIVAESVLRHLGHRVTTANSGQQALILLQDESFDAALLDISMPEMSGVELAHAIISRGLCANGMDLIAMTGNVMPDDIRRYFDVGITGFVEKPVDIQSLAESLAALQKGPNGKFSLDPQERVRFSRREKAGEFDRGRLNRMLEDIGHENVIAIVSSSIVTMQASLSLMKRGGGHGGELSHSLHKVQSVAGLLGFEPLARIARSQQTTVSDEDSRLHELQKELASAIVQLQAYEDELVFGAPDR